MADVNVLGVDELRRGTLDLFGHIEHRADEQLVDVARERAGATVLVVPRVTGRLAASVTSEPAGHGSIVGLGDAGTPYAGWIEFGGTRGRPYIPEGRYLYPTALEAGHAVEQDMTAATRDEIRGYRWPKPTPSL